MKFSEGDNVILKNTGEEGMVSAIIDDKIVEVAVNGTRFPVCVSDLDHPYFKWFTEKNAKKKVAEFIPQIPKEHPINNSLRLPTGVHLSFIPVFLNSGFDDVAEYFKIYIINELHAEIEYTYEAINDGRSTFSLKGRLKSFGNQYLHNQSYADISNMPKFEWSFRAPALPDKAMCKGTLKLRPIKLFELMEQLLANNAPSFSIKLADELPEKKNEVPEAPVGTLPQLGLGSAARPTGKSTFKHTDVVQQVVDLHIDKLMTNIGKMTNAEIITLQLDVFKRHLNNSIAHRQEMLVVVHGLGKGTLREEVHKILKKTPQVVRFKNEWSGKYGFGATEIWFKYF
jgi:Smr domain